MRRFLRVVRFLAVALAAIALYWALAMPYSRLVAAGASTTAPWLEYPTRTLDVYMESDRFPDRESRLVVATFLENFSLKGIKLSIYAIHCNIVLALILFVVGFRAKFWTRLKWLTGGMAALYASHVGLLVFAVEMVHLQRSSDLAPGGPSFFWARVGQIDSFFSLMVPVALWLFIRSRVTKLDLKSSGRV